MATYKETVEKIKSQLKQGDIEAIADKAGYSRKVFENAVRKDDWCLLTKGEQETINIAIEYLLAREEAKLKAEQL